MPLGNPPPDSSDYYALVCRAWERPRAGFWAVGLRDPLPDIPIPLEIDVPEVLLPLRPCIDHVYDTTRYAIRLRYDDRLTPRLRKPDAAWVAQVLAARGGQPPAPPTPPPASVS